MRIWCLAIFLFCAAPAWAAHAYAQFGDIKYAAGFGHFDYVNPDAPKGGEIKLPLIGSSFDKLNPFTLKGTSAPGLGALLFDTLLAGNMDETATAYGLLAEDVEVAPGGRSVTFRLNPKARFHNGEPVLAADVKHSFDSLTSKAAAPQYRIYFSAIKNAVVLDERRIRFDFSEANRELPLIVGSLPVFSRQWGAGKPLDQIVTEQPIGSGPYRIGRVDFGKNIVYQRDPGYWANALGARRGQFNFDRIQFDAYRDPVAAFEAFKAGEFDFIQVYIAKDWARRYKGGKFNTGELIRREWQHQNAVGFQGFVFNTRVARFSDPRVRQAIGLAMDYEWLNRQIFYGAYTRLRGYFTNSAFEARGLPDARERALLDSLRRRPAAAITDTPVPMPPVTSLEPRSGHTLRDNLRQARDLLAAAGWTYRDGALRNAQGEAFTIEFLDSSGSMARVVMPYVQVLGRLGIQASFRLVDFAVYEKRLKKFDFEMISSRNLGRSVPGSELEQMYRSSQAHTEGSSNFAGVDDPVVDELVARIMAAQTRRELEVAVRVLDRVLRHGFYAVPHWYSAAHRVAYRAGRFEQPGQVPPYYEAEDWALSCWWSAEAAPEGLR
ncbi:MAG: extracellular solute-binding protein [Hylemonella sp.]|nr:extracellular solute-binding protein [Hylemonella sp.]